MVVWFGSDVDWQQERDDGFYMRGSVELARKALMSASPNQWWFLLLSRMAHKVIGQGFHPKAGQLHIEVLDLRYAADVAENATAYVSLEPCNHRWRSYGNVGEESVLVVQC